MKDNKKSRSLLQQQTGEKQERTVPFMPLTNFITFLRGKQEENDRFMRVFGFCVKLYLVIACVWAICKLLSEIFTKMGVG